MKQYGMDVVQQMEKMLVDELSASIDKEIVKNIFNIANSKSSKRKNKIGKILEKNKV